MVKKNQTIIYVGLGVLAVGLAIGAYFLYEYMTKSKPLTPIGPGHGTHPLVPLAGEYDLMNVLNQGVEHQCLTSNISNPDALTFISCLGAESGWKLYSDGHIQHTNGLYLELDSTSANAYGNPTRKDDGSQKWQLVDDGLSKDPQHPTYRLLNLGTSWCMDVISGIDRTCKAKTSAGWVLVPKLYM